MARARNIKPGVFKNEILGVADPLYTLLFEGLWLLADRAGRLEDRPLRIKGEVFPYRDFDADAGLEWLQSSGFIRRYEVAGKRYIQVLEFAKHQSPHKNEPDSSIPAPEEIGGTSEEIGSTRADCGFLIPDSGLLEKPPAAPAAPAPAPAAKPKAKKSKPETKPMPEGFCISDRVRDWATRNGHKRLDEHFEAFVSKCRAKGYEYVDWDEGFMGAVRDDWAKLKDKQAPPGRHTDSYEETQRLLADRNKGATGMPAEIRQFAQQIAGRKHA